MDASNSNSRFDDSEVDWDVFGSRSQEAEGRRQTGMDLLAWAVLILLTFCPALGFALATWWWR